MRHVGGVVSDADAEAARRRRIASHITALQRQFDAAQRRRGRQRMALTVAVAVACAAGLVLWVLTSNGNRAPVLDGAYAQLAGGQLELRQTEGVVPESIVDRVAFDSGRELVSRTESQLRLPSHSTLELAQDSHFRLGRTQLSADSWAETVVIDSGSVDLDVPNPEAERQLLVQTPVLVQTPDASIEAKAAQLSVSVPAGNRGGTRVHVIRGQAIVRSVTSAILLEAGQSWQAPTLNSPEPQAPEPLPPTSAASEPERATSPAPSGSVVPRRAPSRLGEANRLMHSALLAKSGGMHDLALQRFIELIQRYPSSQMATTARAERFRLLAKLGRRSEAEQAAKQYLKVHPHGFASAEAHALLDRGD